MSGLGSPLSRRVIDVWAKFLSCDLIINGALNKRRELGWNRPITPIHPPPDVLLTALFSKCADLSSQFGLVSSQFDGFFEGFFSGNF